MLGVDVRCVWQVHRLVIVDEEQRCAGIVSLSDILSYIVLRPAGELPGGAAHSPVVAAAAGTSPQDDVIVGGRGNGSTVLTSVDECPDLTRCACCLTPHPPHITVVTCSSHTGLNMSDSVCENVSCYV